MRPPSPMLSWMLLLLSCLLSVGAFAFASYVSNEAGALTSNSSQAVLSADRAAASSRTHLLASATAGQRDQLESMLGLDVLSIAGTITAAGESAGVRLEVSQALPEALSSGHPVQGRQIGAIAFTVGGSGSFSDIMRAFMMLENLPLPSAIESVDLSETPNGSWQMNTRIRVLTTSPITP